MKITDIVISKRYRNEMGDLHSLAESIENVGLLHPVVVTPSGSLVAGRRRIEAAKLLGWSEIPVTVARTLEDVARLLIAEHDENKCRLDLTPNEAEAIAKDRAAMFALEAAKAQQEGQKRGGGDRRSRKAKERSGQTSTKAKRDDSKRSKRKAAAGTGYSEATLAKVAEIKTAARIDPEYLDLLERLDKHGVKVDAIYKEFKRRQARKEAEAAAARISEEQRRSLEAVCDIRHCSIADLFASSIRPDAVITDPPYGEKFLPLYGELAELAKSVPLVAVMCGQSYLPAVLASMCVHLKYRWTLAYLTPGGQAVQQHQRKIQAFWKPVILFGESNEWIADVCSSDVNDNDKRYHQWGQSESGMADLIDRLTKPGQLVCDPFLGGGATAAACVALKRRFVGCDIDAESVAQARRRMGIAR